MDPGFTQSHQYLRAAYALQGKPAEAAAELEQALKLSQRGAMLLAWAGSGYAFMGRRKEAQSLIREMLERARQGYVAPQRLALMYSSLGDPDRAFEY
jgi:Flp pilus assembly protein TadD